MSIWDASRYGFAPVYWVQISGVPVIFAERETGLSLPSGYTSEDGSLSIDGSAEIGVEQIDRETGSAVSLSLSFKLLDTGTVRDWMRRWSKSMTLTADLTATGTTLTVNDTTGWSNGEAIYLGPERATIGTVASGTSCTGLTRATVGTLAYEHDTSTTAQIITDRPRFWRGRDVILWASPCDASGYCTGSALTDDAVMVWRGRIDGGPSRDVDGFAFEASSLDRVLARGLVGSVTGTAVDIDPRVAVSQGWTAMITIRAQNAAAGYVFDYTLQLSPFDSDSDGDLLTHSEVRDRFVDAWAQAVSDASAGADLSALTWSKQGTVYTARTDVAVDATIVGFEILVYFGTADVTTEWQDEAGGWAGGDVELWSCLGNPIAHGTVPSAAPAALTVKIDEGAVADIPASGKLQITAGEASVVVPYDAVATSQDRAYFTGIYAPGAYAQIADGLAGAEVKVLFTDSGDFPVMMLRALMSSGNGERSATYDTLARGQGLGLHEDVINADSFTSASAPIGTLQGEVSAAGRTFSEMFGGALGLFRKAVVCRYDTDAMRLVLVDTAPYGAGHSVTITDTDLLSDAGDPVLSARRADSPNVLAVLRPHGGVSDKADRWAFVDAPMVDADGTRETDYNIPATNRAALRAAADPAAVSHLAADQTTQAMEIRVGPWIVAEVGAVVWIDVTHSAMWTWSTSPGTPGYTGPARVVGRRLELKSQAVTLTVLADAGVKSTSLSPSAVVDGFDVAGAPTYIDIPLGPGNGYLKHMQEALTDAAANVWVNHYTQGAAETDTQLHEISAATAVGGQCRLTVATTSGGHSLSTAAATPSYLTLPTLDGAKVSTWQAQFAHVSDGTLWG